MKLQRVIPALFSVALLSMPTLSNAALEGDACTAGDYGSKAQYRLFSDGREWAVHDHQGVIPVGLSGRFHHTHTKRQGIRS